MPRCSHINEPYTCEVCHKSFCNDCIKPIPCKYCTRSLCSTCKDIHCIKCINPECKYRVIKLGMFCDLCFSNFLGNLPKQN